MKRQRSSSKQNGPSKRRRTSRPQSSSVSLAVRQELRKKADWKYTDLSSVLSSVSTTGTIQSILANLGRGTAGINAFTGNDLVPQAITLKYYMQTNQTYNAVRFMVFQWFSSTVPTLGSVLQSTTGGISTISATLVTNKRDMRILYDRTHVYAPTASGDTTVLGNGVVDTQIVYIPGKRLRPVRFNSTADAIVYGQIYVLTVSDDALVSYPSVSWYSRVTFSD